LKDFDCARCPRARRDYLGCTSPGQREHFSGTPYATRICPRRHIIDNSDVTQALALWRATDGKPGLTVVDLSPHVADAFAVISEARSAKMEAEERAREAREALHAPTASRGRR